MAHSSTKSIDVGSMFLMDLSVCESDQLNGDGTSSDNVHEGGIETVYPSIYMPDTTYNKTIAQIGHKNSPSYANKTLSNQSIDAYNNHNHLNEDLDDYMATSLDRLSSAINGDTRYYKSVGQRPGVNLVTIVEPQPPPDITESRQSASSISDESFVASSENSLSTSYTTNSQAEDEERGSTTTREDSGVLDMKDIDRQLCNSYDVDGQEELCHTNQQQLRQEKPISSNNTRATNLINMSANNHHNSYINNKHPEWSSNKPTNANNNSNTNGNYHHHHQNYRRQSKHSISASLPIQVPARQMKKNLNKSKVNLMNKKNLDSTNSNLNNTIQHNKDRTSLNGFAYDDEDEFFVQEYNDNHHNHYPIDEFEEEHLRAGDDPMKLFESIQALARSLHKDTELFGSLPPKRLLESPIRSLALV